MKIVDSENCITNFFFLILKIEEVLKMGKKKNLRTKAVLKLAPKIETNNSHEKVKIIQHWSIHVKGLSDPTSTIAPVPFFMNSSSSKLQDLH
jgi:hypothetical protein